MPRQYHRSKSKGEMLMRAGFSQSEAEELAKTSREGMRTVYFKAMINSRRALKLNAIRYEWTLEKFWSVVNQQYIDRNALQDGKPDVWKMLRYWSERRKVPQGYESPWRKRINVKRRQTGEVRHTSRLDLARQKRQQLLKDIDKATATGSGRWLADLQRELRNLNAKFPDM